MSGRERLIVSAQELLWLRGYVATSPKAIQGRAEVGQGSMYHHFNGKAELAAAALRRSAAQMRAEIELALDAPGSAVERIGSYLRREREALRGCRLGGLTQDPEVVADPRLRQPIDDTLAWLTQRIAAVLAEGQQAREISASLDPAATASTIVATIQGGYVLARAANSVAPFDRSIEGVLALLAAHAIETHRPAHRPVDRADCTGSGQSVAGGSEPAAGGGRRL